MKSVDKNKIKKIAKDLQEIEEYDENDEDKDKQEEEEDDDYELKDISFNYDDKIKKDKCFNHKKQEIKIV